MKQHWLQGSTNSLKVVAGIVECLVTRQQAVRRKVPTDEMMGKERNQMMVIEREMVSNV